MSTLQAPRWWLNYPQQTRVFVSLIVLGCVAGIVVPAGIRWDFGNFYDAGRRLLAGDVQHLYLPTTPIAGQPPQATTGFWGAPLTAYLYVPIAWLPPIPAMMLFKLQTAVFNAGALVLLYRQNLRFADPRDISTGRFAAMFALVSLLYQPIWTAFRTGGQTTPMVFFLLALSLVCVVGGRVFQSALCFVLAVMVKPVLITAIVVFVLLAGWRYLVYTASLFLVLGFASVMLLGFPVHEEFFRLMQRGMQTSVPWMYNSGLGVTFENLKLLASPDSWPRHHEAFLDAAKAGLRIVAAATCGWVIYRGWARPWPQAARRHFSFLMALSVWALLGHIIYEAYLTFLFIPLAYALAVRRYSSAPASRLLAVIFALAVFQNIVWVSALRQFAEPTSVPALIAIGLFKSGPLLVFLVWLATSYSGWLRSYDADAWKAGLRQPEGTGKA